MKHTLICTIAALGILPICAIAVDDTPPPELTPEEAQLEAEYAKVEAANRAEAAKLVPPADATPEMVIEALYKMPVDVFFTTEYPEFSSRFFTSKLKEEIDADFKRFAEEMPTITEDQRFFGDAEATLGDVKKLTVRATITDDTAIVKASFELGDVKQVMTYPCEKEDGQWRIADVKHEDGGTLMKMLAEARQYFEESKKEAQ